MPTAVISMVKNEADIIAVWLESQLNLFDHIFIADHMSVDGTHEYLQSMVSAFDNIHVYRYREPSYDQDLILNLLRAECIQHSDAEWIFVLDSDEFLDIADKAAFQATLHAAGEIDLLFFCWRNCYPEHPTISFGDFEGFAATDPSSYGKIAMRRSIASDQAFSIPKGAHWMVHVAGGIVPGSPVGELLHFPVRSVDQIWKKVLQGCQSYLAIQGFDAREGTHWFDLLGTLLRSKSDWDLVPNLVHDYGHMRESVRSESLAQAFNRRSFNLSTSPSNESALGALVARGCIQNNDALHRQIVLGRLMAQIKNDGRGIMKPESMMIDRGEIKHLNDLSSSIFSRLPDIDAAPLTVDGVTDAAEAAFWEIKNRSGSAWGEHIPFLFSLMTLMRPRRYVELGVHNGPSFFAACQSVATEGLSCECVAVDNWNGDEHSGAYQGNVFAAFRNHLSENYGEFAGYLRMNFDEAASKFEDGSIDVLHIDGFHTANAVRQDFESWISKLSDQAIVLFHDTNEFKSNFGVWRFWKVIRARFPYIEFGHGHGLGVLIVGKKSPLQAVISGTNTSLISPEITSLLQVIFANVGRMSWTEFKKKDSLITPFGLDLLAPPSQEKDRERKPGLTGANKRIKAYREAAASDMEYIALLERTVVKYDRSIYGRIRLGIRRMRAKIGNR